MFAKRFLVGLAAICAVAAPAQAHVGMDTQTRLGAPRGAVAVDDPSAGSIGTFSDPFEEPTIAGRFTDARCVEDANGVTVCKPAAGSVTILESGKVLYWNALEGTERIQANIVAEYGRAALNDQTRVLDVLNREWSVPSPPDAGANPEGNDGSEIIIPGGDSEDNNDGALFCSDLNLLPDGRVLAVGGTSYYFEPEVGDTGFGLSELEGIKAARIYDPETDTWSQTGSMAYGRWYPTLLSLPNGDQFVASGVTKLLKPIYPSRPTDSGTNVTQTETYSLETGKWTDNGAAAARSLPLYPRLHLLPDGRVFYNAAGQSFNPFGQAYDEATWNVAALYDPATKSWEDLGVPGLETSPDPAAEMGDAVRDLSKAGLPGGGKAFTIPGFRGSTFSVMLPLEPPYAKAEFLTAGGVLNPPSPGSYFTTSDSRITAVEGGAMTTRATGDLNQPRWYPSGILLPTGEVLAVSGSDRDHVDMPGVEFPVKQAELFDPETETWRPVAIANRPRTYHNSAALLPDGRVLVGGHAPITTAYTYHQSVPGAAPNDGKDPSFEIYRPPYLFRGSRPRIERVTRAGETFKVRLAKRVEVDRVVLMRQASNTHVIDADQRSVVLPVLAQKGRVLTVAAPPSANVAPPGPYLLFVNRRTDDGPVPSRGVPLRLP